MVDLMPSVSGKDTVKKNTRLESRKFGPQAKSLISFVALGKSTSPVLSIVILQVKLTSALAAFQGCLQMK